MKLSDFTYELPENLIASHPTSERSASRLLGLDRKSGAVAHYRFAEIINFLNSGDLLVFNNTRVIPARLYGRKESGGRVEILIERQLGEGQILAQVRASKSPKQGNLIRLCATADSEPEAPEDCLWVVGRRDEFIVLESASSVKLLQLISRYGHMPLPPYIKREDQLEDKERYQTVYAEVPGAVAAPTAGLHFDEPLLEALGEKGVGTAFLTLHVGAGTFQPVRVHDITTHRMHSEWVEISAAVAEQINACKDSGGRIIAVGTTSVRSLEAAATAKGLSAFLGETDIFIYPGYEFQIVDAMITNFHLPESTLLMLVSAFCSKNMLLDAYAEAIAREYRFFSYGDAMLIY
ncbi:MAG: tRNA preQ1(34) S-adenosylmethionine ribosyltransferase-isomerase QueA [Pseudomonadales bacterium]|nr:tRNA preQ1(34) S-adenosylmethionine ribosyltransferase-isomerase QueA [Pseudomonadales bacterium]